MPDTACVRWITEYFWLFAALGYGTAIVHASDVSGWKSAVTQAARTYPEARIVVLDVASGRVLAANRFNDAARTLAAPGSTLKPLVLYALVRAQRWSPERRIACDRQLSIAGRHMACTHPAAPPFDAREALTWSCNSYFAAVAQTLRPGELGQLLRPSGLLSVTGLAADEATAEFRAPQTSAEEELAVLGTAGIRVTPLELAIAYRWLALQLAADAGSQAAQVVRAGIEDSASFGMAGEAGRGGMPVMGKTGTAEGVENSRTHGWFAGLTPVVKPQAVIVVYLPAGHGADAAHLAGEILKLALPEQR